MLCIQGPIIVYAILCVVHLGVMMIFVVRYPNVVAGTI